MMGLVFLGPSFMSCWIITQNRQIKNNMHKIIHSYPDKSGRFFISLAQDFNGKMRCGFGETQAKSEKNAINNLKKKSITRYHYDKILDRKK